MNQDNTRQMTQEELQKTLVLNLKDVEEVVRVEKKHSKKPAILLGVIGLIALLFGSSFQIITIMKEKKEAERMILQRKEPKTVRTHIDCNKTTLNNPTNTDDVYSFSYYFEDGELTSATKVLSVIPTPGNTKGKEDVKKYLDTFKPLMNSIPGYEVSLIESETGFIITVEIDYKELDVTKLNPNQKKHILTNVDYELNDSDKVVLNDMESKKFNCK